MAWTQRFIDELARPHRRPRFVVESLRGFGLPFEATAIRWSSHAEAGYDQVITREGTSLTHGSLSVGQWTVSPGGLSVGLTRQVDRSRLLPGLVVHLRMGFDGWAVEDFEPIFVGVLTQLGRQGRRWMASFGGLEGQLNVRWGIGAPYPSDPEVFLDAGTTKTLDIDFVPGATTLDIASSTEPRKASDGDYLVRVMQNNGETILVKASGLSSPSAGVTRLTGCTFGEMDSPGHTDTANAGNDVVYLVWDEQHPLRIAQRLVTSSDSGNGAEDVYPREWGLGVPESVTDPDDWAAQRVLSGPDGMTSPGWHLLQDAPATTFGQWLTSYLADGAFWLCQRQGLLTGRGLQALESQSISLYPTDRHLLDVQYTSFGGQLEYRYVDVHDHGGRTAALPHPYDPDAQLVDQVARLLGTMAPTLPPVTGPDHRTTSSRSLGARTPWGRPSQLERQHVLPVFGSTPDRSAWRLGVLLRVLPYMTRRTEPITVTLAGLHWSQLGIGDALGLITGTVDSRRGPNDLVTKGGWHTVVGGGMNPFNGTTTFQLVAVSPDDES